VFPEMVQLARVTGSIGKVEYTPPPNLAELPDRVQFSSEVTPPKSSTPPPAEPALLPEMVLFVTVTAHEL